MYLSMFFGTFQIQVKCKGEIVMHITIFKDEFRKCDALLKQRYPRLDRVGGRRSPQRPIQRWVTRQMPADVGLALPCQ